MKRMKWMGVVVLVVIAMVCVYAFAETGHQFDKTTYVKVTKKNIGRILTGNISPSTMKADMEKLISIGLDGCREHMSEPDATPVEKKLLEITIKSVDSMRGLSLDQIEEMWHEGGFLKSQGVDIMKLDHFSHAMCHYDSVLHPLTAILCLNEYERTQKDEYLDQMKAELAEVAEHMEHLD
ncbi:MAG: hypothetical protein ACMUIS_10800 [bacterium]